jgi:uncharacterized membrane protein YebE (DUF533 family)
VNPEDLLGSLLRGALLGRGKNANRAIHAIAHGHPQSLIRLRHIVGAAAVAWGVYEAHQAKNAGGLEAGASASPKPDPPAPAPPLPIPQPAAIAGVPPEIARAIRLLISASRADGELSPEEGQKIARLASEAGFAAEALVRAELQSPRPLDEIVAGVEDPAQKAELYALAFTLLRADESVTGAERIYLAQLAHRLGLDAATAARVEQEAAASIDKEEGPDV